MAATNEDARREVALTPPFKAQVERCAAGALDVALTIDIEFTVGGAFTYPDKRRPVGPESVYCPIGGKDHGLPFLLSCLREYDLTATFFVEALHTVYFGDAPMGRIVDRLLREGHDVQLHIHPCWLTFRHADWQERVRASRPNDACSGRSDAAVGEFIDLGLAAFERWGAPRPMALRTGNLDVDREVYRAMAARGLPISSSVGVGYFKPRDPMLHLAWGRQQFDGVLEVPITSFNALGPRGRQARMFSLIGTGYGEAAALLKRARRGDPGPLVMLTHAHEFIRGRPHLLNQATPNRLIKRRFAALCRFLARNSGGFRVTTFGAGGPAWLREPAIAGHPVTVPAPASLARMAANKLNDLLPVM